MTLPFLETLGLSQKESQIYELLLKLGETPAGVIIKNTGLKRATTYKVLASLEKHGLVTHKEIEKIIRFKPEPPTQLTALAENQYQNLERAKEMLKTVLPGLSSAYLFSVEKPVVSIFEGVEGLKDIYEDTLREKKTISALLTTAEIEPEMYSYLTRSYAPKRAKAGIKAKVILASGKKAGEYEKKNKKELRETRVVSSQKFPFKLEVDIYGDKIAFINYKKEETLMGIIIKNPLIAQTAQAWFNLAWQGAAACDLDG